MKRQLMVMMYLSMAFILGVLKLMHQIDVSWWVVSSPILFLLFMIFLRGLLDA